MPARRRLVQSRALHHGLLAVLVLLLAGAWFGQPAPVAATTAAVQMDGQILTSINKERTSLKLVPFRLDGRLVTWATDRAAWMASAGILTHTSYGGSPCNLYNTMHVTWYQCGEAVAETNAAFGGTAASALYSLLKNSPEHDALMASSTFNYVGIGVAYRASNHTTYLSILFLEGPERNRPIPSWTSVYASGGTVHWSWTAYDPLLQTHTGTIRNYDVELRRNNGTWHLLRSGNPATSATFRGLPPGTSWALRIRARDNYGNVSGWLTSTTLVVR